MLPSTNAWLSRPSLPQRRSLTRLLCIVRVIRYKVPEAPSKQIIVLVILFWGVSVCDKGEGRGGEGRGGKEGGRVGGREGGRKNPLTLFSLHHCRSKNLSIKLLQHFHPERELANGRSSTVEHDDRSRLSFALVLVDEVLRDGVASGEL